jgi:hypothetical protein
MRERAHRPGRNIAVSPVVQYLSPQLAVPARLAQAIAAAIAALKQIAVVPDMYAS